MIAQIDIQPLSLTRNEAMNHKTKKRVILVLPVVVALVVVSVVMFFVMFSGAAVTATIAATAQTADASQAIEASTDSSGPSCAFDFLVGLNGDVAQSQIASLGRPIRVLGPDSMATQDYAVERINLHVDDNGVVQSVDCQ
jgi:hypothetical protein